MYVPSQFFKTGEPRTRYRVWYKCTCLTNVLLNGLNNGRHLCKLLKLLSFPKSQGAKTSVYSRLDSRAVVVAEKNWGSLRIKLFITAVTNIQLCKNHKYCRFTRITFQSKLPINLAKVLRPTNIT